MCAHLSARGGAILACWFIHGAFAVTTCDVDSKSTLDQGLTSLVPFCDDASTCSEVTEAQASGSIHSSKVPTPFSVTGSMLEMMPPREKYVGLAKHGGTPLPLLSPFWNEIEEEYKEAWDIPAVMCDIQEDWGLTLLADVLYKVLARPVGGIMNTIGPTQIETILMGSEPHGLGIDTLEKIVDQQFKEACPLKPKGLKAKLDSEFQKVKQYRREKANSYWDLVLRHTTFFAKLRRKVIRPKEQAAQRVLDDYNSFVQAAIAPKRVLKDPVIQPAVDTVNYLIEEALLDSKDVLAHFTEDGDDINILLKLAKNLKKRGHCSPTSPFHVQAQKYYDAVAFLYQLTHGGKQIS